MSSSYICINKDVGIIGIQLAIEVDYTITEVILSKEWEYYRVSSGAVLFKYDQQSQQASNIPL